MALLFLSVQFKRTHTLSSPEKLGFMEHKYCNNKKLPLVSSFWFFLGGVFWFLFCFFGWFYFYISITGNWQNQTSCFPIFSACLTDEKSICSAHNIALSAQNHRFFLLMAPSVHKHMAVLEPLRMHPVNADSLNSQVSFKNLIG